MLSKLHFLSLIKITLLVMPYGIPSQLNALGHYGTGQLFKKPMNMITVLIILLHFGKQTEHKQQQQQHHTQTTTKKKPKNT